MFHKTRISLFFTVSLLLFSCFSFSSKSCYAEGPKLWIENSGDLNGDQVTNGKVTVTSGFFGTFDLRNLVKDNPAALAMTEKQSQFNTYAHLSYWLGVLPSAGVMGYGLGSRHDTLTLVSLAALIGTTLLTGHFIAESRHYMFEAMNIYNGVKPTSLIGRYDDPSNGSFAPDLASKTVAVSFHF